MKTTRLFESQTDRYAFDWGLCSAKNGFAQVDTCQDAGYFGTWANPTTLTTVSYAEGDIVINQAETDAEFVEECRAIKGFYDDQGYKCAIDGMCDDDIIARFNSLGLSDLLH